MPCSRSYCRHHYRNGAARLTEEQIKVAGSEILSDRRLGQGAQPNCEQIPKGQPVKASPDGACGPLVVGTEGQLVRTAEATHDAICVRRRDEQDCSWTSKLGIEPVATYDREQANSKGFIDRSNEYFDRVHPECKGWRENRNLPDYLLLTRFGNRACGGPRRV
jgi:hypothetical protein